MFFKKFFTTVGSFFKNLFSPEAAEDFIKVIERVAPLVNKAYPIVEKIAKLTPTKSDDEILSAYQAFGINDVFTPSMDKSEALRNLAKTVLQSTHPSPVSEYLINTAIEMAYAKLKEVVVKNA